MSTMTYPRTMTRGPLKGRTFKDAAAHRKAKAAAAKKGARRRVPVLKGGAERFTLDVVSGSAEVVVTGDPRSPADVDLAVAVLRGER
jgi:hypothetical protein